MTHRSREALELVMDEVRQAGLEPELVPGNHYKVRFFHEGRKYLYVFPKSTSDRRALMNCKCGIRRLIRLAVTSK